MKGLRLYIVCALTPLWAAALSPLLMINPLTWAVIFVTTGLLHWTAALAIAFVVIVVSLGIGRIVTNWETARLEVSPRAALAKANAAAGMIPTVGTSIAFLLSMLFLPSFNALGRWFAAAGIGFWAGTISFVVAFALAALRTKRAERSSASRRLAQLGEAISEPGRPSAQMSDQSWEVTWNDLFLTRESLPNPEHWVDIAGPLEVDAAWQGATTFGKFFARHDLHAGEAGEATLVQEIATGNNAPGLFAEQHEKLHALISEVEQLRQAYLDDPESRFAIACEFDLDAVGDEAFAALLQDIKHTTVNKVFEEPLGDLATPLVEATDSPLTICHIRAIVWLRLSHLMVKLTVTTGESQSVDERVLQERRSFAIRQAQSIAPRAAERIAALKPHPI